MKDTPTPERVDSAKRTAVRRRAKRGLVAGYIHEISARHGSAERPHSPAERTAGAVVRAEAEASARV